jgi:hypothetical protein
VDSLFLLDMNDGCLDILAGIETRKGTCEKEFRTFYSTVEQNVSTTENPEILYY